MKLTLEVAASKARRIANLTNHCGSSCTPCSDWMLVHHGILFNELSTPLLVEVYFRKIFSLNYSTSRNFYNMELHSIISISQSRLDTTDS